VINLRHELFSKSNPAQVLPIAILENMKTRLTCHNAAQLASHFVDTIPNYPDHFDGCGIVICAGGIKYNPCAWVLVRLLRHLGCQLPIEIWHAGNIECDPQWTALISRYDVVCRDALKTREQHPHPRLRGWPIKPYAILHSRFEEILFLDADNVPVKDPTFLFECQRYDETGAVFWPDIEQSITPPDSPLWQLFGVPYQAGPDQESGQILINKSRCWKALNLCNWYNEHADFYYRHVYGDKDTFRFAWQRLGQPISWIPTRVSLEMPHTLLQHDFAGNVLFQHRFGHKWSLFRNNPKIPGFEHEDLCLSFLNELRQLWHPEQRLTNRSSRPDLNQMRELIGAQFVLERVGFNRWPIEFGEDCNLRRGKNSTTWFWRLRCRALVLATPDGKPSVTLRKTQDGTWEGRAVGDKRLSVRLIPTSQLDVA
jgi:hypothetical protein